MEKTIIYSTEITTNLDFVCDEPNKDGDIWYYTVLDGKSIDHSGSYNKQRALSNYRLIKAKYQLKEV